MRPKDRHAAIQSAMETIMKRMKEADHGWDDQVDVSLRKLLTEMALTLCCRHRINSPPFLYLIDISSLCRRIITPSPLQTLQAGLVNRRVFV